MAVVSREDFLFSLHANCNHLIPSLLLKLATLLLLKENSDPIHNLVLISFLRLSAILAEYDGGLACQIEV